MEVFLVGKEVGIFPIREIPRTSMANLKSHVNSDEPLSVRNFIASRFSRHPERYFEIFGVLRKYELHHVAAQFMNHQA